ncbi:alpha/beta hydrolase [Streptomyces sp. SID14515]|uniref:alpha/beta fold hydrolase n=1 Tax=Streptomyces sp. SID14515 TaxID=2706074 RepID=UPI0013C82913|nr:alpha/beta hydrolase [Streptomyces sp. SID14515]NEB40845.1 alpha/beta hydrolase [Streptomyces sp. SID14515]NEB42173.1 alpha/beta hydrolase [Streptomyces sp. SID14515]
MRVSVGGLVFDVEVSGPEDGDPVLLLHGFPQSRHAWDQVVPALHSAGLRTIAPDQRGYSDGARPTGPDAYALPLLAADATGILDALGVGSAHVVGHDWGAVVAWCLAARHSARVRTLTAVSFPHPEAYWYALRNDPEQRERSRYLAYFASPESTAGMLAHDAAQLRSLFGNQVAPEQVKRYLDLHTRPGVLDATLNWYRSGSLLAEHEGFGSVGVPTTYVWSDEDRAASRVAVDRTAEHVTGPYRSVSLEGIGHWQPEQAPDRIAAEVVRQTRRNG